MKKIVLAMLFAGGGLWAVEAGLYNETRTRAPLEQTSSSPSQRHRIPFLTQIPKQAKPAGPDRRVFALDFHNKHVNSAFSQFCHAFFGMPFC